MYDENFKVALERYKKELLDYAKKNQMPLTESSSSQDSQTSVYPEYPDSMESSEIPENTDYSQSLEPAQTVMENMPSEFDNNPYIPGNQEYIPMKEESGENVEPPKEEIYNTYEDFLKNNQKAGTLRVQTFVAGRAFPVSNSKITITKNIAGKDYIVSERTTDESGIASNIILPAPDGDLSETPPSVAPYSTYDVLVEHPNFIPLLFKDVPIFDGVESIQPVEMRPLIIDGDNKMIVITETEPEDLMKEEK